METTLFIRPSEVTEFTPLGGNVDPAKYTNCIYDVQVLVIQPMLGEKLYEKIYKDFVDNTLTGKYKELFDNHIKHIMRHQVFAEYVETGSYVVANAGIFKHAPQNSEVVTKSEVQYLAGVSRSKAQTYIERAKAWLSKNNLSEYTACSGNKVTVGIGWKL